MYLTQKNHLKGISSKEYEILRFLCHEAKSLYNCTKYEVDNYYDANGSFLYYEKAYHVLNENEHYVHLPSQVAQQVMKQLNAGYMSFFSLLKLKSKGSYNQPIEKPHYLPKKGYYLLILPKDSFKMVENNRIRISLGRWVTQNKGLQYIYVGLPPQVVGKTIKELRLLPRDNGRYFELEYVYLTEKIPIIIDSKKYLSIDLGLNNFATVTTSLGTSFILEGRGLKSYNRWWNKQKAKLQSRYDIHGIKFGRKMGRLLQHRKDILRNAMNQYVNYLITICKTEHLGNIVIGELKGIKQHGHLGKHNNQHFQSIPYGLFKQKLRSKCDLYGIAYHEVDEAYTSQTCSHCGRVRKANRKHRGLYVCDQCKKIINADVNGSLNIGKKVAPNYCEGSSGIVNIPKRITLVTFRKCSSIA